MELVGDVEGRNVVIVDDMADTLGTLKKASELIMAKGAKSVRAIATHGILSGAAMDNLYSSQLTELMVSDSIPSTLQKEKDQVGDKLKVISCDNIIARTIWGLTTRRSIHEVTRIFKCSRRSIMRWVEKYTTDGEITGYDRKPIATKVVKGDKFYKAEDYHQRYLIKNPNGYTCHYIRDIDI